MWGLWYVRTGVCEDWVRLGLWELGMWGLGCEDWGRVSTVDMCYKTGVVWLPGLCVRLRLGLFKDWGYLTTGVIEDWSCVRTGVVTTSWWFQWCHEWAHFLVVQMSLLMTSGRRDLQAQVLIHHTHTRTHTRVHTYTLVSLSALLSRTYTHTRTPALLSLCYSRLGTRLRCFS
jgi:hypothetical protein